MKAIRVLEQIRQVNHGLFYTMRTVASFIPRNYISSFQNLALFLIIIIIII
jgi:hypothetical protein